MTGLVGRLWQAILRPAAVILGGTAVLYGMSLASTGDLGFSTEEESAQPLAAIQNPTPLDRLAVVALFRTGFIRQWPVSAAMGEDGLNAEPAAPEAEAVPFQKGRRAWAVSGFTDSCTMTEMARAVLAAEGYARPAWRREAESAAATMIHSLTGHLPDWSFGLGQIRLSTAETALQRLQEEAEAVLGKRLNLPLDRLALFHALGKRCANSYMVEILLAQLAQPDEEAEATAARYRGGRSWPTIPSILSYEALVAHIAEVVLPSIRDQGGDLGIYLGGGRDRAIGANTRIDLPDAGLSLLACLLPDYIVAYRGKAEATGKDDEGADGLEEVDLRAADYAAAGRALQASRLVLVPPEILDETDTAEVADEAAMTAEDWSEATGTALVLRHLATLGERPRLVAPALGIPAVEEARQACGGLIVLAEGPRAGWDMALKEAAQRGW